MRGDTEQGRASACSPLLAFTMLIGEAALLVLSVDLKPKTASRDTFPLLASNDLRCRQLDTWQVSVFGGGASVSRDCHAAI